MDDKTVKSAMATMYRYHATSDQVAKAIDQMQKGVCEICNKNNLTRSQLDIEHNHTTGKFRGITCHACNCKIGSVEKLKNWDTCSLDILDWITYKGH